MSERVLQADLEVHGEGMQRGDDLHQAGLPLGDSLGGHQNSKDTLWTDCSLILFVMFFLSI